MRENDGRRWKKDVRESQSIMKSQKENKKEIKEKLRTKEADECKWYKNDYAW